MNITSIKHLFFFAWLFAAVHGFASETKRLPDLGDPFSSHLSIMEEQKLGEKIMQQIQRSPRLIRDPSLNQYIKYLGHRLVAHADNSDNITFHFFLIDSPQINAFALPGGYIGIHTGLLIASESESELASVISHEIAHVTQRHIARRIKHADQATLPAIATVLASILLIPANPQAAVAALHASQAGFQQMMLNFSRDHETEADHIGIKTLASSGLDPSAAATFFQKLQNKESIYGDSFSYLSTHPVTQTRIASARARADKIDKTQINESLAFNLMKERAIVNYADNPHDILKLYQDKAPKHPQSITLKYGLALSLLNTHQYEEAKKHLRALNEQFPNELSFITDLAGAQASQGNVEQAIAIIEKALGWSPKQNGLTLEYIKILVQSKNHQKAYEIALEHSRTSANDPQIFETLSTLQANLGLIGPAHESQSQRWFLIGDLQQALEQLQLAQMHYEKNSLNYVRVKNKISQLRSELFVQRYSQP